MPLPSSNSLNNSDPKKENNNTTFIFKQIFDKFDHEKNGDFVGGGWKESNSEMQSLIKNLEDKSPLEGQIKLKTSSEKQISISDINLNVDSENEKP